MPEDLLDSLGHLSDSELPARVEALAARQREATALLLAHLAEIEARGLHLKAGFGSLFAYCREALALSEGEAYSHVEVSRAARRFPAILDKLAGGSVNLTTARLLAPHLTHENHQSLLESARGKRRAEVEVIVAGLQPWPDVPPSIRKLPALKPASPPAPGLPEGGAALASPTGPAPAPVSPPVVSRPVVWATPLSPSRYKLQFTIGEDTLERLRLAKDMLRHAIPSGDEAAILDRALTALLADLARKKFAATPQPRPSPGSAPGSRHIPADVKRAVWVRDLGRCAFLGTGGRRCNERGFLEFHHVEPYAVGGEPTAANIQLRCKSHNGYEARLYFGDVGQVRERVLPYGSHAARALAQALLEAARSGPRSLSL